MEKIVLKAKSRKEVGRKVKLLRKGGILPANIYGKKIKSESIQIGVSDFRDVYKKAGETGLIYLELEGGKEKKEERPVLVANIQKDPVSDMLLHIDFHQVDLKEKVEAKVPVELVGESPAEKQSIGTVVQYLKEIEVEALPTDLPEKFQIDISALTEVDQMVHVKDLPYDKSKIEVKTDIEEILIKVEPPQKEEVIAPPVTEVSAEGEVPAAEGEIPATEEGEPAKEEAKPKE
jgi:large subunit ribosomal protein L25